MTTKSPSSVEPEMPLWATITQCRPIDDVVPDLDQIINFRAFADDRVLKGAPVDGRIGADFDVVLDDHPADLRHLQVPAGAHGEAEAVLADAHARMDDDPVADEGMGDGRQRPDVAVAADGDTVADHGAGGDARAAADAGLGADDGARARR